MRLDHFGVPRDEVVTNLVGELVALGPQRRDLESLYQKWLNDFSVMAPLGSSLRPITGEDAETIYEQTSKNNHEAWFTVYEKVTMRPLGIAGLRDIDKLHRTAELVIFLGEKERWGQGYGTEATRLTLDYGFTALGLENIMLRVFSFNERAIRVYEKVGFQEIGRRRSAFRLAGKPHDVIFMDFLAADFASPVLRRILTEDSDEAT